MYVYCRELAVLGVGTDIRAVVYLALDEANAQKKTFHVILPDFRRLT